MAQQPSHELFSDLEGHLEGGTEAHKRIVPKSIPGPLLDISYIVVHHMGIPIDIEDCCFAVLDDL
jgi:hypothetical protein